MCVCATIKTTLTACLASCEWMCVVVYVCVPVRCGVCVHACVCRHSWLLLQLALQLLLLLLLLHMVQASRSSCIFSFCITLRISRGLSLHALVSFQCVMVGVSCEGKLRRGLWRSSAKSLHVLLRCLGYGAGAFELW